MSPILILVAVSAIFSTSVQSQLTFDRMTKDYYERVARGKLILTISDNGRERKKDFEEGNEDFDPLYQRAHHAAVKLLSGLGISDDVQEFMIQESLYSCYLSELKDGGHKFYGHRGLQVRTDIFRPSFKNSNKNNFVLTSN